MTLPNEDDTRGDAETHATDWAGDSARLEAERGYTSAPAAPPGAMPPAASASTGEDQSLEVAVEEVATAESPDDDYDPDTATGASPGMANACHDLGLFSLDAVTKKLNIKPPGQA